MFMPVDAATPHVDQEPMAAKLEQEPKADILVVDDSLAKLLSIEAILEPLDQNIIKVTSGREALRRLLKQDFAAIILDVNMPEMDGFETAAMIRERPRCAHTPIIFMSAISHSEMHAARGYSVGAVDYIITPIVPEILRTKVGVFVELFRKTEKIRRQAERLREMEEREHRHRMAEVTERFDTQLRAYAGQLELESAERMAVQQRLAAIFNQMIVGIAQTDPEGRFMLANQRFCEIVGRGEQELLNLRIQDITHPDDSLSNNEHFDRMLSGDGGFTIEKRYLRPDGSTVWVRKSVSALFDQDNQPICTLLTAEDVTERKKAEQDLLTLNATLEQRVQDRTAKLQQAYAELDAFSYSVSHDLRAPLRHINGFAMLLEQHGRNQLDERCRGYLQTISKAVEHAGQLVDDLLGFSRMGRTEMRTVPLDMNELLYEVRREVESEAADRRIEWNIEPLPAACGDPPMLRLVMRNLLSNAIKYTRPRDPARIEVGCRAGDGENVYYVRDNGVGFDMKYVGKLFGVFQRLHRMEDFDGTGIGLANVRRIVQRHGGRTWAEGEVGKGATFYFTLPNAVTTP